jgi:tape measure domain-containing protein
MKRLSDAFAELGGDDAGFNAMAEGLDAIHVSAEELNKVDMTALASGFDSANGSMSQIIATLEAGGVQMNTWNAALEQAPGAAQNMSSLTAAAFNAMYTMAGGDINATMTLIAGLDSYQVGDKTFYVGDNGSVTDSQGKVYDLKTDIDELPDEVKAKVGVDNSDAKKKTKEVDSALDKTGKKRPNPKITANDSASSTIANVNRKLNLLNGKTATTYIKTVTTNVPKNQATGGMNSRPVIPKHASGYIATGPTLTNQGWIGEDGVEAVANWATGGAVVPLTNKRYMLPIADAIADGMSRRGGGGGGVTYNTYINDAVVNDDAEVQAAVINLLSTLQRKGAMNRG